MKPTNNDIVIAVVGSTGAGMSTFINAAINQVRATVGHELKSCTSEVRAFQYLDPNDGTPFVFVDTPGFDDSDTSDEDILIKITRWLKITYSKNFRLAGIIYLHRISDHPPVTRPPLRNIGLFADLCGTNGIGNVILATTMWDLIPESVGSEREAQLKNDYWKGMLSRGSQVKRFRGTFESAWDVVNALEKTKQVPSRHPREIPTMGLSSSSENLPGNPSDTPSLDSEDETPPPGTGQTPDTSYLLSGIQGGLELFLKYAQYYMRKIWKSGQSGSSISSEELSENDVIIALMGSTGAGKSSFIKMATGFDLDPSIGHTLQSCTTEIGIVRVQRSDFNVVFVDTPGFSDATESAGEILAMIAQSLKTTSKRTIKLSGILYLHRISDNRVSGSLLRHSSEFKKLFEENGLHHIILTTTMWDEVQGDEGVEREKELKEKSWMGMISQGSTVARYTNTAESAWEIVEPLIRDAHTRSAIGEIAELQKRLPKPGPKGVELYTRLEGLIRRQQDALKMIRVGVGRSENERAALDHTAAEYEELQKTIEENIAEMQALKLPLGERLVRILMPLGPQVSGGTEVLSSV